MFHAESSVEHGDRDLRLPAWGPYSKRYAGVSHVADSARGVRFDLSIVPGYFRGDLVIPDGLRPSRFHPWEAAAGLLQYTYRYELEWKDQVYCDVSFTAVGEHSRLVSCVWVNNTGYAQRVVSHAVASLDFARIGSHREWLRTVSIRKPAGVTWVDALDYVEIRLAGGRADAGLIADGLLIGEARAHGAVGGSVLTEIGQHAGDAVSYSLDVTAPLGDAVLRLRHRIPPGTSGELTVDGPCSGQLHCVGDGEMHTVDLDIGSLSRGAHRITLSAPRGSLSGLEIDGFLVGEREEIERALLVSDALDTDVDVTPDPSGGFVIKPQALERSYGVSWAAEGLSAREFVGNDLDLLLRGAKYDWHGVPGPSGKAEDLDGPVNRFTDILAPPVMLPAYSQRTIHGIVCEGSPDEVSDQLAAFSRASESELQSFLDEGHRGVFDPQPSSRATTELGSLLDSQRRMAAAVLTNVVYPIYMRRQHVRHFAPGRWWDSLYTWDSGMIGLGLIEIDPQSAEGCLEAYLTGPGDPHSAYIHHGTTVPTQQYLAAELLSRGGDRERFARWYPGLREQYRFLSGNHPESRTRMPTGLLNPFAYFYNSGGWDDYPAQAATHRRGLAGSVAPMVTTSHAIRAAKLLLLATAGAVGNLGGPEDDAGDLLSKAPGRGHPIRPETVHGDAAGYVEDIGRMSSAVQQCWDPDAGYFGYATHDAGGALTGVLRDDSGVNFNMGIDGVYPLVAGACTSAQSDVLLDRLFSPDRLWTDIGFSTVDRSAPYFNLDGYWNGQLWIAHQWFLFKALLDLGRPELARRIAEAVLEVWTTESERTYNTWEHFSILTGRGNGWHQFGGLSAPVLNLFAAYYRTGSLTTGFDTRVLERTGNASGTTLTADLLSLPATTGAASAVAVLVPGHRYGAFIDGERTQVEELDDGVVHITWSDPHTSRDPLGLSRRSLEVRSIR